MSKIGIVDGVTYRQAHAVLAAAARTGEDPVERLQRAGLLLTPAQDKRIRLEALSGLLERFRDITPAEFIRTRFRVLEATTQMDLWVCIHQWMEDCVTMVRNEGDVQ